MKKLLATLGLALATACTAGDTGSSPPVINDFQASPASIHAGETATLSWDVRNASTLQLDGQAVSGTSKVVTPGASTTYTLTATNSAGITTSTTSVTVVANVAKPVITAFGASPSSVATGGNVTLTWTITGQVDAVKIDPGSVNVLPETSTADPHSGSHVLSNVTAATTYTLTATNAGGSVTSTSAVTTHSPNLQFNYADPASTTAKLKLVRNAALSTNTHLVLDLKVGAAAVSAFGVALTLPFSSASAGMVAFAQNGLTVGSGIGVGSSPNTSGAMLVTSGTALPNTFTVGVARHKSSATDTGDVTLAAGSTVFSVAFDFGLTTPSPGTTVFSGTALQADPKFRAAALKFDGTAVVSKADIAVGDFLITN